MTFTQTKTQSGSESYTASWLQSKLNNVTKPAKQTDTERYLAALYNCGEAAQ